MKKKYQIFILSTYTDLQEERQVAVQAILDAGHIPAGMELFKAGNASQLQTIYRWIDESDIYLLILGGRYGSIEPDSQKRYTQLEYEYAVNQGIPVFAIVINEDLLQSKIEKMGYKNIMEQKHPDKLEKFLELVLSKIVCFASDNKDITIGIITAKNEITELYPLRGWGRGPEIKTESDPFADCDDELFRHDEFKGADEIFYDDEVKDSPNKGTDKHEIKTLCYINDDCICFKSEFSARIPITQKYNAEFHPQANQYNPPFAVLCRHRVCPLKRCR